MIENTSKRGPLTHLLGAMGSGSSDYITGMEAQGQRELVNSDRLPVDTNGQDDAFRELGFQLGDPDPNDPLFRPATLPEGWRREGSDHAMWSHIVDEQGRERIAIFYKAAFYDRCAFMDIVRIDEPQS